jgi:uncharacterized cysteine cluster protein YcgN (CxxCxxCC family)
MWDASHMEAKMTRFKKLITPDSMTFLPIPFSCDHCGTYLRGAVYTDTTETRFKTMYCDRCTAAMAACDEHDARKAWED